jgi:hypothetical protein
MDIIMIIVRLIGGLGNQLFQYAIGRRIALKNKMPLKLDITWCRNNPERPYNLNHFSIIENFATEMEIDQFKKNHENFPNRIFQVIKELSSPYYLRSYVREKTLDFDPNIFKINKSAYLDGHWQSEKYFIDIEDQLRKDFLIKTSQDEVNRVISENIKSTNSVSIHIRRGDYISNKITNQYHGTCSREYFNKAIDKITSNVDNPHFFVFSDDPQWAMDNLNSECPINFITNNNAQKNYEDLRLMTYCKHFIIANSSFSWWGAWLSSNADKIVIAPSKWFDNQIYNDKDRLPEKWIRLSY